MTDRVLIPFNGTLLALTLEQYADALAAAAELAPAAQAGSAAPAFEPLVDADTAATQLGISARWLEDCVRAGIVPHHRLGRFVRFRPSEVAAHFRVDGAPPPTDSQSVTAFRRRSNQ